MKSSATSLYKGWYRYLYSALDIAFEWMPNYLVTAIATVIIFVAGTTMRGEWLFIVAQFLQSHSHRLPGHMDSAKMGTNVSHDNHLADTWSLLTAMRLQGLASFLLFNLAFSYIIYFFICGFLQWYFYIRRRNLSKEWKCQPDRFLPPEIERHEIILGTINITLGSLIFAFFGCYTYNGGKTSIYFQPSEYGWTWFFLSIPVHFIYQDGAAYYVHRILHMPFFYTKFHKWHHYYKHPTAFSATAMHPFDFIFFQFFMLLPALTVPLHAVVYMGQMVYIFYYSIMIHSGIHMESFWPWQTEVAFHDNHHQYYHVNFGFHTELFDRLHGTRRNKGRVYNEQIFSGKGLDLGNVSEALKTEHALELSAEIKSQNKKVKQL